MFMLTEPTPADDKIRCDACPVMCYIKPGAAGACDRYANHDGQLVRVDLPVSELSALGIWPPSSNVSIVPADIIVGQDGYARAVRLVQ